MTNLPTITQATPPLPLDDMVNLVQRFGGMTKDEKLQTIDRVVNVHAICSVDWGQDWRYRRARVMDCRTLPKSINELIWRTDVPARIGRANPAGVPLLYVADRRDTSLSEVHARTNDFTVITDFRILENKSVRIIPIGELTAIQRTGHGPFLQDFSHVMNDFINACDIDEARSLLLADTFLMECLLNRDDDYVLSARVATAMFNKHPQAEGIAFASTRQFGGISFALKTETFWDMWGVWSMCAGTVRELGYGFYELNDRRNLAAIDQDGQLTWSDEIVHEMQTDQFVNPWSRHPSVESSNSQT